MKADQERQKTITERVIEEEKRAARKRGGLSDEEDGQNKNAQLYSNSYDVYLRISTEERLTTEE